MLFVQRCPVLLGGMASCGTNDSAYSYTCLCSVVCLSVVCHIHARCLNRFSVLNAFLHVHLWAPMTHCVRWGPLTPREGQI